MNAVEGGRSVVAKEILIPVNIRAGKKRTMTGVPTRMAAREATQPTQS